MNPARALVAVLIRSAVFLGVICVVVVVLDHSDSSDPLGAGLLAFFVLVTVAFAWGLTDGILRGFLRPLAVWVLTSVVAGIGIPVLLAIRESDDVVDQLRDGALFFALLLLVPAVIGVGIGSIFHRLGDRPTTTA